jgi:hypothetical protein
MTKNILVREAQSVYDWARRFNDDEELGCWCAICSYEVFKRLRRAKLNPTFVQVWDGNGYDGHCFVECQGYIVDVTARQFIGNLRSVEVRYNNPGYWFWVRNSQINKSVHKANTTSQIQKLVKDWPSEQNPFKNWKEYWERA